MVLGCWDRIYGIGDINCGGLEKEMELVVWELRIRRSCAKWW